MRFFLLPLSVIFHIITTIRNWLFDYSIFSSTSYSIPIICIGNLSIGGSGKTPHTNYIINILKKDFNIAVLSRGYGRITREFNYVEKASSSETVGDEPLFYKKRHPEIIVAVENNRNKGVRKIIKDFPDINVILLDDGLQHRWINPGLKIVITKYYQLYCHDYLLPFGNLRESKSGANRCDIIIVSKCPENLNEERKNEIRNNLNPNSQQKIFFSEIEYKALKPMGLSKLPLDLYNYHVILITGIAETELMIQYLKSIIQEVTHLEFSDHHKYSKSDIKKILHRYKKVKNIKKLILTTEKDAVKLVEFETDFKQVNIYTLPIDIKLKEKDLFEKYIVNYVKNNKKNS